VTPDAGSFGFAALHRAAQSYEATRGWRRNREARASLQRDSLVLRRRIDALSRPGDAPTCAAASR